MGVAAWRTGELLGVELRQPMPVQPLGMIGDDGGCVMGGRGLGRCQLMDNSFGLEEQARVSDELHELHELPEEPPPAASTPHQHQGAKSTGELANASWPFLLAIVATLLGEPFLEVGGGKP